MDDKKQPLSKISQKVPFSIRAPPGSAVKPLEFVAPVLAVENFLKKYRTLNDDLEVVKKVLEVMPDQRPPFSFRIDDLALETCIIKLKKIACKALKGKGVNSGLRLIYAYFRTRQINVF